MIWRKIKTKSMYNLVDSETTKHKLFTFRSVNIKTVFSILILGLGIIYIHRISLEHRSMGKI